MSSVKWGTSYWERRNIRKQMEINARWERQRQPFNPVDIIRQFREQASQAAGEVIEGMEIPNPTSKH